MKNIFMELIVFSSRHQNNKFEANDNKNLNSIKEKIGIFSFIY